MSLVSIDAPKTKNRSYRNSSTKLHTIFRMVTRYSFQPQLSAILIDQNSGHVLAVTGGRGDKTTSRSLNRATNTYRSPGSTFKPISTFAPAIDAKGLTLSTVVEDLPFTYNGTTIRNWWSSDLWMGNCNARQALI